MKWDMKLLRYAGLILLIGCIIYFEAPELSRLFASLPHPRVFELLAELAAWIASYYLIA